MKILSYNVASFGAHLKHHKGGAKGFGAWLTELGVDIACIQETKLQKPSPVESCIPGYESFFAPSPSTGMSGVATIVRLPWSAVAADIKPLGEPFDGEGRTLVTDHGSFYVINVYVPNSGEPAAPGEEPPRLAFKMRFLSVLSSKLRTLRATGKGVILCGDLNIAPRPEDVHVGLRTLPHHSRSAAEVEWADTHLSPTAPALEGREGGGGAGGGKGDRLIDTWRVAHPTVNTGFTVWRQSERGREKNAGTRIDVIALDPLLYRAYCMGPPCTEDGVGGGGAEGDAVVAAAAAASATGGGLSAGAVAGAGEGAGAGAGAGESGASPPTAESPRTSTHFLKIAAASAALPAGTCVIVDTSAQWSDHVPVLLSMRDPPPPPPHKPVPLSSTCLHPSIMSFFTMGADGGAGGGAGGGGNPKKSGGEGGATKRARGS